MTDVGGDFVTVTLRFCISGSVTAAPRARFKPGGRVFCFYFLDPGRFQSEFGNGELIGAKNQQFELKMELLFCHYLTDLARSIKFEY